MVARGRRRESTNRRGGIIQTESDCVRALTRAAQTLSGLRVRVRVRVRVRLGLGLGLTLTLTLTLSGLRREPRLRSEKATAQNQ
jgi:hypothetical protein